MNAGCALTLAVLTARLIAAKLKGAESSRLVCRLLLTCSSDCQAHVRAVEIGLLVPIARSVDVQGARLLVQVGVCVALFVLHLRDEAPYQPLDR